MNRTAESVYPSGPELVTLQAEKLNETIRYVADKSTFYREMFMKNKIDTGSVTPDTLQLLPFTTKDDLANRNKEFLCVDKSLIADYVATSGSTNVPVTFYVTAKDLDRLAFNEESSLRIADCTSDDIVQLMTTMDKQFMAGLAYFLGTRRLGAGVIRVGPGSAQMQWDSIRRFSPTVLIAVPSFIPKLLSYADEFGIDYSSTSVKTIICIGEPIRNEDFTLNKLGQLIVSRWNVKLYSTYASTEISSAFTECSYGNGGHLNPELAILEVVTTDGRRASDGEMGEVVVTTLGVEGMPLLRYRTGDISTIHYSPCRCGRNTPRLGPIAGRIQQMIKYKGTTLFPGAIFEILDSTPEITMYQVQVSKDEFENDRVVILLPLELKSEKFDNHVRVMLRAGLRVTPDIEYIKSEELKAGVFDENKRKMNKIIYK